MDKQTQNELLAIVRRNYEEIADEFQATREKPLWPELVNLARIAKDGDRVLDIGCGNGRLLQALLLKKIYYLGLDQNQALLDFARRKYPDKIFRVGDILRLGEVPEMNFDLVFVVAVLHHLPGSDLQTAALRQLKNKIKPNGRIIILVWNLRAQKKFRWLVWKFSLLKLIGKNRMDRGDIIFSWKNTDRSALSQRYYHAFRQKELKKLIRQAGLKVEKIYSDCYNIYAIANK